MADPAKPKSAEELARGTRNCANWCYWIAGLTAVNAGLAATGSESSFVAGATSTSRFTTGRCAGWRLRAFAIWVITSTPT